MVSRRSVIGGTTVGAMVGALFPRTSAQLEAHEPSDCDMKGVVEAVDQLRREFHQQTTFWELDAVRQQQRTFLRNTGKYPDLLEVGTDVWQLVHDWHIKYRQPVTINRDSQGRYTILLMGTTIIMRPDLAANYVGVAYDNR